MDLISESDLASLFQQFCVSAYHATVRSPLIEDIQNKCETLFSKDYKYHIVNNTNGELAASYPSKIILLEREKTNDVLDTCDRFHQNCDPLKLKALFTKARGARCRTRFPVPVILYQGKNICRSATISCHMEVTTRKIIDFVGSVFQGGSEQTELDDDDDAYEAQPDSSPDERLSDTQLLQALSISHICDLMVEEAKIKYGIRISSSEKMEMDTYSAFNILCLPYPGCEFFNDYRLHHYCGEGLMFDWSQPYVNSGLILPSDVLVHFSNLGIELCEYKKWDLIKLTQNYIKVVLRYITEGTSGLLIHCISGWDRTPLFISLLRLSLWADGKVHASLTTIEILYLTLAYDWYLFGHKLPERLKDGQEILFFCFQFLKHLTGEEFSIVKRKEPKHLLDPLLEVLREDSQTGLSSKSSSFDSISQESLPPVYFSVPSREPSPCDNGNVSIGREHTASKHESTLSDTNCNTSASLNQLYKHDHYSSVPVPVPNVRRRTDSTSSIGCGSWQIITGAGSVRGSVSSKSSVSSPPSEVNHNIQLDRSIMSQATMGPPMKSHREEKLESVRNLFNKLYIATRGDKSGCPSEIRGQSTFYQIAEKVGIASIKTPDYV